MPQSSRRELIQWPIRITKQGGSHDRLFHVVHIVRPLLAFGLGRTCSLSNRVASVAPITNCRNRRKWCVVLSLGGSHAPSSTAVRTVPRLILVVT
jgi:hypothetical protein